MEILFERTSSVLRTTTIRISETFTLHDFETAGIHERFRLNERKTKKMVHKCVRRRFVSGPSSVYGVSVNE